MIRYELDSKRNELIARIPFADLEKRIIQRIQQATSNPKGLSARELQVLDGVRSGKLNKEIAEEVGITERTVKFHVKSLFKKFRVTSRFHLTDPERFCSLEKEIFCMSSSAAMKTSRMIPKEYNYSVVDLPAHPALEAVERTGTVFVPGKFMNAKKENQHKERT